VRRTLAPPKLHARSVSRALARRAGGITELGGIVYVLIILIFLTLAIPLAQAANFLAILLYDVIVLVSAAGKLGTDGVRELADTARKGAPPQALGPLPKPPEPEPEPAQEKGKRKKKAKEAAPAGGAAGEVSAAPKPRAFSRKRGPKTGEAMPQGVFSAFAARFMPASPYGEVSPEDSDSDVV
jgi:hypothetical protein